MKKEDDFLDVCVSGAIKGLKIGAAIIGAILLIGLAIALGTSR